MKISEKLIGRQWPQASTSISENSELTIIPGIQADHCNRCGNIVQAKLPSGQRYCRTCIGLGRITEGEVLVRYDQNIEFPQVSDGGLTWHGELTPEQAKISNCLVKNYLTGIDSLVHAVTGAGKTEMLFPLLAQCLAQGKRACIATPRIDVVNELYPRLSEAFAKMTIGKYYGREYSDPGLEQLTICTTHQLLKFYHAFDLLVIDEVDSFPYVNDPQLHFGALNSVKVTGRKVFLTATPTADLLEQVKQNKLCKLTLKRRFHGGLLPVPEQKLFLKPFINQKGQLNQNLQKEIRKIIATGHPLLLFVPRISEIDTYVKEVKKLCSDNQTVAGVHAADKRRLDKVQNFREGKTKVLVTTTILERGVTFRHVWVIIIAADDPIYTTASLVQIAGRVGRDKNDRNGRVLYCYHRYTKQLKAAMKQIKEMNQ